MKLALEQNEITERNKHKNKKRNKLYNIENEVEIDFNDEFFNLYYQHLDTYLIRNIRMRNEIIERNITIKTNKK